MLYNGYAVQELHGSDADLNEVRGSRPEADDSTQLVPDSPPCCTPGMLVSAFCIGQSHGSSWCFLACTMADV